MAGRPLLLAAVAVAMCDVAAAFLPASSVCSWAGPRLRVHGTSRCSCAILQPERRRLALMRAQMAMTTFSVGDSVEVRTHVSTMMGMCVCFVDVRLCAFVCVFAGSRLSLLASPPSVA